MTPASSGLETKYGRLRILQVEVVQNGHRLEHHVVAVLQYRYAAARIHFQHLRRLMLLLVEVQQLRLVLQPLVLERQEDAPRKRTAAAPVKGDCHGAIVAVDILPVPGDTGFPSRFTRIALSFASWLFRP